MTPSEEIRKIENRIINERYKTAASSGIHLYTAWEEAVMEYLDNLSQVKQ